jgi:hypothetical protein
MKTDKELVQRVPIKGVDEPLHTTRITTPEDIAKIKSKWMGLTEEEINAIGLANGFGRGSIRLSQTINAIEVRLKEKNHN